MKAIGINPKGRAELSPTRSATPIPSEGGEGRRESLLTFQFRRLSINRVTKVRAVLTPKRRFESDRSFHAGASSNRTGPRFSKPNDAGSNPAAPSISAITPAL